MEIQRCLLHKLRSIRDLVFQPPTQGKIPSRAAMTVFLATDLAERRCRAPRSTTLQAIFIIPNYAFLLWLVASLKLPVVEPMILVLNPALLVLTQQQALPTLFVFDRTRFLAVHDGNGTFSRDLFTVSSHFPFSSSPRRISVSPAPAPKKGLVALSTSFGAGSATWRSRGSEGGNGASCVSSSFNTMR